MVTKEDVYCVCHHDIAYHDEDGCDMWKDDGPCPCKIPGDNYEQALRRIRGQIKWKDL